MFERAVCVVTCFLSSPRGGLLYSLSSGFFRTLCSVPCSVNVFVIRSHWLTVRSFSLVHFTRLLGSGPVGIPCRTESLMDELLERNCYLMVSLLAVCSLVQCLSARDLSSYVSRLLCSVIVIYSVVSLFQSSLLSCSSAMIILVPSRSRWLAVRSLLSPGGLLYRSMFERSLFVVICFQILGEVVFYFF